MLYELASINDGPLFYIIYMATRFSFLIYNPIKRVKLYIVNDMSKDI
jgi:hypothetical protein